jgi:hypothetical protein
MILELSATLERLVYFRVLQSIAAKVCIALIHTLLQFNVAQDVGFCPRFAGSGNESPQTGHT